MTNLIAVSGVTLNHWKSLINDFGFPLIAIFGLAYFTWFIWKWVTKEVNPSLDQVGSSLGKLKRKVEMFDNDLIRLNIKLKVVLQDKKKIDELKRLLDERIKNERNT